MKTGMALLVAGTMQGCAQIAAPDLEARLARAITNVTYQPPAPSEFARARELFAHTLRGDQTAAELKTGWAGLGFEFNEVAAGSGSLWLVCEPPGKEAGRGWYLFRTNAASTTALEAPHAKNDVHTGVISLRLFLAGDARVLAESTITRHRADMAHLDDTFFQAFTLAFADVCPTGLVVQLHGFETENHGGTKADIIASAGTPSPEAWFGDAVQALKNASSWIVLAYPTDIKQLGATTNAQGKALNKAGHCRFYHLEFTKELRDRLTRDEALRRALLESLPASLKR